MGSTQPKQEHPGFVADFSNLPHQRMDLLQTQSPTLGMANSPFSDFQMNFQNSPHDYPGFSGNFDRAQISTSAAKSNLFHPHRGSVSNMSEGTVPTASARPHRLSISSADFNPIDNTSPGSATGMGTGEGSTMTLRLDGNVSGDGGEGSVQSKKEGDEKGDPPPWSEMKTKAGKERKRLPLACIACRRKKIRCSGEKPACKHCLRSRIPCVYKVTTRKAAPRTDYMAMLDKRLKRMEDRVIKLIPKESLGSISNISRSVVKPALPGAPPKPATSKKRAAEEAFGGELDEWSRTKSANPNIHSSSGSKESEESRLLTEGAESLPPKDMQEHLAEVYFDYVYGQSYPLLHKPSFMRKLAAGKVPPVLILAICAISARFSTHPQLRTEPAFLRGENWAERAREIALKRYDLPNITILIVYLILGLHEFGTCQGGRSWMFGGMAQRMAYALQLHKDLEYDPTAPDGEKRKLSFTDREIRRRTMWSCFLMDRFNSSGTDRPLFVNSQFITAQLPVKEQLYIHEIPAPTETLEGKIPNPVSAESGQLANAKENMGVASYLIRLVCLWGKLITFMNLGGKDREAEPMWSPKSTWADIKGLVKFFKDDLPEWLRYNEENLKSHAIERTANQFLYLHILYQQIILFMNRFSLPSTAGSRPPKDMPHDFLTDAARTALEAANQISILINDAMEHNVVAPFAGYSAFFSSTVHVHGVFSKNPKLETMSKKYLAYNVKYLTKMRKYWGMFHYIAENLKDLYRQHADAVLRGPAAVSAKGGKANIFQYGDWFDRYPHGVSSTDYEDPAVDAPNEAGTDAVLGQKSDLQSVEEFFASLSPPSKAEQQKKMARRNTNSKVPKSEVPTSAPSEQFHPPLNTQIPPHIQQQMNHIPIPHDAMDTNSPFDPAYFHGQPGAQAQANFMPDFNAQQLHLNTSPTSMMPQMDMSPFGDMSSTSTQGFWMDSMGVNNNMFLDPTTAFFLPFNVDPPTLGEDGAFDGVDAYNFGLGAPHMADIGALNGQHPRGSVSGQGGQGIDHLDHLSGGEGMG